jgi:Protein of unknown function (DUF2934)
MSTRKKELEAISESVGDTTAGNPDRDRIERRAYELYQARGGGDGRADEDWFAAEQEISNGRPREKS